MAGQIVAICNQKGGVGKTTLTFHLGVGAAREGLRVVVVDADPQGNLSSWCLDGDTEDAGLFRLLVVDEPLGRLVRPVRRWGIGLLPGNHRTGEAMTFLAATSKLEKVASHLSPLREVADIILIDMPPSRAAGFVQLLGIADGVVVPTQPERLSLEGVVLMAQTAQGLRNGDGPQLWGVVPNQVRGRTVEHREQIDALVELFGATVWPPIPLSVRVSEASAYGTVLYDLAPHDPVSYAMGEVLDRFLRVAGRRV
jgi:chromosome partitioning protein